MTSPRIALPKADLDLAELMQNHGDRCDGAYIARRTNWLLAWYYLNGYRRFDVYNPTTGAITPHYLDEDGRMEYQSSELLYHINQVAGRIQSMDLRPKVEMQGSSLNHQRNRSISQIVSDAIFSDQDVAAASETWSYLYTCLGFAGISGAVVDHPTIGLTCDIEVIHPRELYPFPMIGQDMTKRFGLFRHRYVTLDFLRDTYGARKINDNLEQMDWYEVQASEDWASRETAGSSTTNFKGISGPAPAPTGSGQKENKGFIGVARVRELWLDGPRGTCEYYAASCGRMILDRQDLKGLDVACPIGWARFFSNGTFHGAGMFDLMFSSHRQLEQLCKSLYQNVKDTDRYGVLVMPQGEFNQNSMLKDVGRGLRCLFMQPDAMQDSFNPMVIQPWNAGDMPGRVAQFARESLAVVNPIQDLIKEKGRVDSAPGLQFLDEQITQALTAPTTGVARAWGSLYKAANQQAGRTLLTSRRALPVGSLTTDLAGAVIDPETDMISFADNPLPDISRLHFTIRALSPRSSVARKSEAVNLWTQGIEMDPLAFRLFAHKEGLDFALYTEDTANAYEMAVRAILILFNDGESPGRLILTPHTTRADIAARVFADFMCGPLMQRASPAVIDAFAATKLTLSTWLGTVLPPGAPNPDEAAMLAAGQSAPALPSA